MMILPILLLISDPSSAASLPEPLQPQISPIARVLPDWLRVRAFAELGTVAVLFHRIQFSRDGTEFDYVREGGQNTLQPFARVSAEAEIFKHHSFVLLYQPLDLRSTAVLTRDVTIDGGVFAAGSSLDLRYGFDFYRFSYLYDFFADPDLEVAIGISLQIRNANIGFTATDGSLRRTNENIGPVPVLKARARYTFKNGVFLGLEVDGFWASGRIITGSTNDFEGAILDAAIRAGVQLTPWAELFLNWRTIGGGARGTEENSPGPGDGYTNNWLWTSSLSLGVGLK